MPGREDVGALRLRTLATSDLPCAIFPKAVTDLSPRSCRARLLGADSALIVILFKHYLFRIHIRRIEIHIRRIER